MTDPTFTAHVEAIKAEKPELTDREARLAAWSEGPSGAERRAIPSILGWQIFDSFDRPASDLEPTRSVLWPELHRLTMEAEAEGDGMSYAIAAVLSDSSVTFDAG